MNQEIKAKWIAALRSGEYPQTKGKLHDANGFCCLGVLCEVAIKEGVHLTVTTSPPPGITTDLLSNAPLEYRYDGERAFLPAKVQDWAEYHSSDGLLPFPVRNGLPAVSLTGINDIGIPFTEIANLIEENL